MAQINPKLKNNNINNSIVFFDVDTQHDYLSEASDKSIRNSGEIKKNLAKLTNYAIENNIKILGSVDINTNLKKETINNFRNKIPETFVQGTIFVPNRKVDEQLISKALQTNSPVLVEKQAYSCFQNPNTDIIIEMIKNKNKIDKISANNSNIITVVVYGVATEYCVKEAVLGLLSRGIKVLLVKDAIGAINEEHGEKALKEMKSAGAITIECKEVIITKEIIFNYSLN